MCLIHNLKIFERISKEKAILYGYRLNCSKVNDEKGKRTKSPENYSWIILPALKDENHCFVEKLTTKKNFAISHRLSMD